MAPAHAMSTGLGIESEGLEVPDSELPPWEESKIKKFPMVSLFSSAIKAYEMRVYFILFLIIYSFGKTLSRASSIFRFIHAAFVFCMWLLYRRTSLKVQRFTQMVPQSQI
jgi:hypothetical protein